MVHLNILIMVETKQAIAEYFQKAADFIADQQYTDAIHTLEEFICMEPREPLVYEFLGDLYLHLNAPQKAIAPLRQAIKLAPGHKLTYELLSKAYTAVGNDRQATMYSNKAKKVQETS